MEILYKRPKPRLKIWQEVLLITASLFVIGFVILDLTNNPNLFPTVTFLGSLMVPLAFAAFFYENRLNSLLTVEDMALSFFYGGVLGVFLASILEPVFISTLTPTSLFYVGFIEELAKILAVVFLVRRLRHSSELNGIIIGVAVGMGFAALESAGYAFIVFLASGGSVTASVLLTLFRALLAPIGHGTWTGILAGVLFLESAPYQFRLTAKVIAAYLGVSLLHGLWNSIGLGLFLGLWVSVVLALVVGVTGLFILYRLWEGAKRRQTFKER